MIGSVVCSQLVESLHGERLLLVQPTTSDGTDTGTPVVACDVAQAGPGDRVLFEGGREAAWALKHVFNPADATVMALIDEVDAAAPTTAAKKPRTRKRS
jgi:ethanolamine utilization protein EutN